MPYALRISKEKSCYLQSKEHIDAFKHLSKIIYGEDTDILFSYGEIFVKHGSDLTYAECADSYTNFRFDDSCIESIDIIKINDISKVSIHPAYTWSDLLFYLISYYKYNDDYGKSMIQSASLMMESDIRNPLTKDDVIDLFDYDLNQVVFKRNLVGVEIVESISNTEDVDLFETINSLANKYNLLITVD